MIALLYQSEAERICLYLDNIYAAMKERNPRAAALSASPLFHRGES